MEQKTAQLRIKKRRVLPEGDGGTIFWATPKRARELLEIGAVELLNVPLLNAQLKPIEFGECFNIEPGPSETKPAEPAEKKSFAAAQVGPSTDSASSNLLGKAAELFASVADRVSPGRKSTKSPQPTAQAGE